MIHHNPGMDGTSVQKGSYQDLGLLLNAQRRSLVLARRVCKAKPGRVRPVHAKGDWGKWTPGDRASRGKIADERVDHPSRLLEVAHQRA